MKHLTLIACVLFLCLSCKKKILEIIPVIETEKDMSITGAGDIKYFSFPSTQVGYAASDTNFIYKTTNGGTSWSIINVASNKQCNGLEFFDELNGMCLMNTSVYTTTDGGQNWTLYGSADFIGKTDDGIGVLGTCGFTSCSVSKSTNKAQSFSPVGNVDIDGNFIFARIVESKVFILTDDVSYNGELSGMDVSNGNNLLIELGNLTAYENPNDIYLSEGRGVVVASEGFIMDVNDPYIPYQNTDNPPIHHYTYYSVDGFGELLLCVGDKTITTNMDLENGEEWNDVLNVDGNGFTNTFYKVRFIDQTTIYISGSNGIILKAKI